MKKNRQLSLITAIAILSAAGLNGCNDESASTVNEDLCLTKTCAGETTCAVIDNAAVCVCGADKEVCSPTQECKEGVCEEKQDDLCKGVTCTGDSVCDSKTGKCLCGETECKSDQICTAGSCQPNDQPDPCESMACGDDKTCSEGKCYCGETECSAGMICEGGECKNPLNLCDNIECEGDSICVDGKCLCGEQVCGDTEICDGGDCTEKTTDCSPACTGDAVCVEGECKCGDTVCDESLTCSNGSCLCGTTECDLANHICTDGVCEEAVITPCTGKVCNYGEICLVVGEEGKCVDELCQTDGVEKVCDPGNKCVAGNCIDERCVDFVCDEGMKCGVVEEEAKCLCGELECPEGTNCVDGTCVDPCDTIQCAETELCAGGECSCDGKGTVCDTLKGEKCIDHTCQIVDTCNNSCADGLTCIDGECLCAGSGRACLDSETCYYDVCVDSLCIDKVCTGENQLCEKGKCIPAACKGVECDPGYGCNKSGNCVYEKCVDVECSLGKTCRQDGTCHFDEHPKLILNSDGNKTSEDDENKGKYTLLLVNLDKAPTNNVTVTATVSNKEEAKIIQGNILTFTDTDYNKAQIIKIAGIRDYVIDGAVDYTVDLKATSDDSDFGDLSNSIKLTNIDVDEANIVITNVGGTTTTEDGGKVTFKVKLSSKPKSDVTIDVSSSDVTEGTVSLSSLKFTKDNWSNEQIITVTGQDDDEADGEQAYTLEFGKAVSGDSNYNGLKIEPIKLVNTDNDKAGVKASGNLEQNEGTTANIAVNLTTKPLGNVTVKAALVDLLKSSEVQVLTTAGVTFTPDDYKSAKNIQLKYLTDNIKDGNQSWKIRLTATSSESDYNGLYTELNGVTKDIDTAELVFGKCLTGTLKEGASGICDIKLSSQPQNTVTLKAVADNAKYGATVAPSSVTFAAKGSDWNTFKTFTFTGVMDNAVDGTQISNVAFSTMSDDKNYNNLNAKKVITVEDINSATVILPTSYTTSLSELKYSTNYSIVVKLGGRPTSDVTIQAISSDTTELQVSQTSLVLTPDKWNTGVTFNYHAVDDSELDGTQNATITFKLETSDPTFKGKAAVTNVMSIADNESAGISVTENISAVKCASSSSMQTMSIKLTSAPTSDVTLNLSLVDASGNKINNVTNGIAITPTSLKFTPSNWSGNQTVTVRGPMKGSIPAQTYYANVYLQATTSGGGLYNGKTLKSGSLFPLTAFCSPGTFTSSTSLTLPKGKYTMTVKGAGGGSYTTSMPSARYGGSGGMASATFRLVPAKTTAYVRIGGGGTTCFYNKSCGGANGGANGTYGTTTSYACGGGGGTDIRLGADSYAKRVIVAGGGGGGMYGPLINTSHGSNGGGSNGQNGKYKGEPNSTTPGGGQNGCNTGGGKNSICYFGAGNPDTGTGLAGGGGGGWYTGATGQSSKHSGAGGSSFIYGYTATGTTYSSAGGTLTSSDVVYVSGASTTTGGGAEHDINGSATISVVESE